MHLYQLPFKQSFYFNRHLKIFGETTLGEQEVYRIFISNFTKAFLFLFPLGSSNECLQSFSMFFLLQKITPPFTAD